MVETNTVTELINQGTYGCVYRPGFTCDGNTRKNKKFISKIQNNKDASKKETIIGKIIKKIDNYGEYFAPIIETCELSVANIKTDKIKHCDIINESEKVYEMNKLRYVGKNTLGKYVLQVLNTAPKQLIRMLINTHQDLLIGYDKLFEAGIIHMDIKENNVMIEDTTGNPIIIDFGLSAIVKNLDEDEYKDVFFTYATDYAPWCIDICMMSYMANELKNEKAPPGMLGFIGVDENKEISWKEGIVTKEHITKVINDFITKNNAMIKLLNEPQRTKYTKTLHDYFGAFVGKRWIELCEELLKNIASWDSYAVSVMYLSFIKDIELHKTEVDASNWKSYKSLLESMIISSPNERKSSVEMLNNIRELFTNISSNENTRLMKILDTVLEDKEKKPRINTNILSTIQTNMRRGNKIYEKRK